MTGGIVIPILIGLWLLGAIYWFRSVRNDAVVSKKISEYLEHHDNQLDKPYHGGAPALDSTRVEPNTPTSASWTPIRDSGLAMGAVERVMKWIYDKL